MKRAALFGGSAGTKPIKERPNECVACLVLCSVLWLLVRGGCFSAFPSLRVWVSRAQREAKAAPTGGELVLVAGLGRDCEKIRHWAVMPLGGMRDNRFNIGAFARSFAKKKRRKKI